MLKVEWLGDTTIIDPKYKEYLITWAKGYAAGPSLTPKYGDWSGDKSGTWDCFRDGQVLSAFAKWWNAKKGTNLDVGTVASSGVCKNVLTADFTPEHRDALAALAAELNLATAEWASPVIDFVPQQVPPPSAVFDFVPQDIPPPQVTCGPGEILVNGVCVPAPQLSPPPATPSSTSKTPWGLIVLGGLALAGAAAWAMGAFKGLGLAGLAENPRDWWGPGQRWLEQEALKEYRAQLAAHRKRGRAKSSFRYTPPDWHRDAVDALGKNDEERFKAIKLARIGYPALQDNPRSVWKRLPTTIGSVDHSTGKFYPNAPVTRVEAFPPGKHPPSAIRKDVTLVLIHTPYGVRQYGFADAHIDSSLRMRVKLLPGQERDEVVARWPSARGGRAG